MEVKFRDELFPSELRTRSVADKVERLPVNRWTLLAEVMNEHESDVPAAVSTVGEL